jgi:hypothetical protein
MKARSTRSRATAIKAAQADEKRFYQPWSGGVDDLFRLCGNHDDFLS